MNDTITMEDLKIGLRATAEQLSDIYNIYMILLYDKLGSDVGTLVYFNDKQDDEYDSWFEQSKPITPIYNDREEEEDMSEYDE